MGIKEGDHQLASSAIDGMISEGFAYTNDNT
jgi:hypothetical protein